MADVFSIRHWTSLILAAGLGLALSLASCRRAVEPNPDFWKILYFQDNRSPADSLYAFLQSTDYHMQIRAIEAIGGLLDSSAVDSLMARLTHPYLDLREAAIFALGQIGYATTSSTLQQRLEKILIDRYAGESSVRHRSAILNALGKCGTEKTLTLIHSVWMDTSAALAGEACLAAARMAIRNIVGDSTSHFLSGLTTHPSAEVRWRAVYAMMRIHDKAYAPLMLARLKDGDYRVRMDAARALGAMGLGKDDRNLADCQNALIACATSDGDWRVRVNAVNALGTFRFRLDDLKKVYFLIAFEGLKDKNEHVRLAAIRAMSRSFDNDLRQPDELLKVFIEKYLPVATPRERGEIIQALCHMAGRSVFSNRPFMAIVEQALTGPDRYLRAQVVLALAATSSSEALPYFAKALFDSFTVAANHAAEALSAMNKKEANAWLMKGLESGQPVLMWICSGLLAAKKDVTSDPARSSTIAGIIIRAFPAFAGDVESDVKTGLIDILGELKSPDAVPFLDSCLTDSSLAATAAKSLTKITGRNYSARIPPLSPHPIDFDYYVRIKKGKPTATVETSEGAFVLDFLPDDAPFSVVNFVKLAEAGYFDGVFFHRVVPNFVIQTGDPTGSGWSGPGYTIRSEFNAHTYDRGMVGMASAGRDTEGSQWFVTHSPQPHLDGRYTIFARVIQGMDVVDRIQVGDDIHSIRITWY